MDERDFSEFEHKMIFGRISSIATPIGMQNVGRVMVSLRSGFLQATLSVMDIELPKYQRYSLTKPRSRFHFRAQSLEEFLVRSYTLEVYKQQFK